LKVRLGVAAVLVATIALATAFSLLSTSSPLSSTPAQAADQTFHVGTTYFCTSGTSCTQGVSNAVHISVGDTVTWFWDEGTHTTTACTGVFTGCTGSGRWNHAIDMNNTTFSFTALAGDDNTAFYFQCMIHGSAMRGVVIVGVPPSPTPSPSPSPTVTTTSTSTATATPTATPPSGGVKGDSDCNGQVQIPDSIQDLLSVAGQASGLCIETLGNVDCTDGVQVVDAIDIQLHISGQPPTLPQGCSPIGSNV